MARARARAEEGFKGREQKRRRKEERMKKIRKREENPPFDLLRLERHHEYTIFYLSPLDFLVKLIK